MSYRYLEPTKAPRGPEIMNIPARGKIISNARLSTYRIPLFNTSVSGHRQVVSQGKRKPLAPYTSPVKEGLISLINENDNSGGTL